eukprot:TRINITY_DN2730_c0_g1_i1.p1 TRINITY_DN2730_c0_g1~~TRINITY_DN2730_c0_g1_i1.p1  ORF type:complete len:402 (-),score=74.30 TRINITY_DN2730_c0_g1_i1:633-1838(-)
MVSAEGKSNCKLVTMEQKRKLSNGHLRHKEMCSMGTILVTGGAGYIGSHTSLLLLQEGYKVVMLDNLSNSSFEAVKRVRQLSRGRDAWLEFIEVDLLDVPALDEVFSRENFDAVIHFAGLKAVAESVSVPLHYYHNNLTGSINLVNAMNRHGCKKLVFSSSATVYGAPKVVPCTENSPLSAINPYGRTKLFIEEMLRDVCKADSEWGTILLRYFNPVGAHPSGRIGEDPRGIPNNLMPYVQQVAVGRLKELSVFGSDYPTADGTCVRDYIHVMDLAAGHVDALRKIFSPAVGCQVYNLGTGRGSSVLEMIAAFEKVTGRKIAWKFAPRRPGDHAIVYSAPQKAEQELGWRAQYDVERMCLDQWNWARNNPWGYESAHTEEEGVSTPPQSEAVSTPLLSTSA